MITGVVIDSSEAIVHLTVRGFEGQQQEIAAVIDTGFNGWLTLPPALIAALSLPRHRQGRAILADGSEILFDTYEAIVAWDDQMQRVPVDAMNADPLLGMSLLNGYELKIQVADGGTVTIEELGSALARQP